ncbi:MAG TPA: HAD hydrolase family protein [Candidatus Gracilibacteria bacterium]|nr:HAD hydrolase family protein [Candidatus Gracilibacteria bacterium]
MRPLSATLEAPQQDEIRHSQVRYIQRTSMESLIQDPFHGIASDYDGVVERHDRKEVAEEIRPLFVEKSLAQGLPLAFITGKEFADAVTEIANPFRAAITQAGIELKPGDFMIYCNNGSNLLDVGDRNALIEQREFSHSQLHTIAQSEAVQALIEIYNIIEEQRGRFGFNPDPEASHYRQQDLSTICFRIDPDDIHQSNAPLHVIRALEKAGGAAHPTRFDIAKKIKAELARLGADDLVVSPTDRSIDITPPGSGKRKALEDFSKRTGIDPENILRIGDSPTGMDYGLLSAKSHEFRGGFTNVTLNAEELRQLQSDPEHYGTTPPVEINPGADQFENVKWLMNNITTTSPWA